MKCRRWQEFLGDETGAVTVDWVALVSATLLLGTMVVYAVFNQGVSALVLEINDTLGETALTVAIGPAPDFSPVPAVVDPPPPPRHDHDDD